MVQRATLIINRKQILANGAIIQIKVWRLPHATEERPHGLKYSLFFGRPGERVIGYDNESGKGDHSHYRDREKPYKFRGLARLIEDFQRDVMQEIDNERG